MDGYALVTIHGGAMNSVLCKLTQLLADEQLHTEERKEIVLIRDKVEDMHGLLMSMSREKSLDQKKKLWMTEVRQLSYRMEDRIDKHRMGGRLSYTKPRDLKNLIGWSKDTLTWVEDVLEVATRQQDGSPRATSTVISDDSLAPLPEPSEDTRLVGRGGVWQKITMILRDTSSKQLKVICIVGSGGVGKTTLAYRLYRELKHCFDCCAFVRMQEKPVVDDILRGILSQVGQQVPTGSASSKKHLVEKICSFLKDKRYFIIFDDMWSASSWRFIKEALPDNCRDSRIMITTRINGIANTCASFPGNIIYQMKPLASADSKFLFLQRVYGSELEEISDGVLEISGTTPLAIIRFASFLTKKPYQSRDKMIKFLRFDPGSIPELESEIKNISRSYHELHSNLKACVLYLSTLPVNHNIDRDWLVRKWIAEGFIHEEIWQGREDVANKYLDILSDRNIIQPVEYNNTLAVKTYNVDCMMLYFLKSVSQQDNFVTLLDVQDILNTDGKPIYRLSVYCPDSECSLDTDTMDFSGVRSLTVFGHVNKIPFENLTNMRVLDLEGCVGLKDVNLKTICTMLLLKYLGLKETQVSVLPPEIRGLQCLETLDVRKTRLKELPKEVVQLRNLTHLLVGDVDTHEGLKLPDGIMQLRFLQVLSTINFSDYQANSLKELGKMAELRELATVLPYDGPIDWEQKSELLSSFAKCQKLQSLVIHGDFTWCEKIAEAFLPHLQKLRMSSVFVKVPKWIAELVFLALLDIMVCNFGDDDMEILQQLPNLQILLLRLETVPQKGPLTISKAGFSSIDVFSFDCIMPWVSFQEGAMQNLKHIELKFNEGSISKMPSGIKNLSSLQKVALWCPHSNSDVEQTVADVRGQTYSHGNLISLFFNGEDAFQELWRSTLKPQLDSARLNETRELGRSKLKDYFHAVYLAVSNSINRH